VARGARLWRSVVGEGAAIESPARVEASLLFAGTRVGERAAVRGAILGPGVDLPAGTAVDGRLLTPLRAGVAPGARDSVVGGLVFTPVG
jgi:ADP-glucose pyrophosphorylase